VGFSFCKCTKVCAIYRKEIPTARSIEKKENKYYKPTAKILQQGMLQRMECFDQGMDQRLKKTLQQGLLKRQAKLINLENLKNKKPSFVKKSSH
jgi:tRNA A37 N6-isopentenylltransferase MiaA